MKPIVSLLLVLLFASCGKQEVYEFEVSTKHREFKHLDFNSTRYYAWRKENPDVPDYLTLMSDFHDSIAEYEVVNKSLIEFFPVDEDGFCFYQIESDYAEKKLSGEDASIRRERITNIDFYDKHSNKLFSFPFDDNNVTSQRYRTFIEGKTSKVSRSLLERVDKEKTKLSIDFAILKKI
jgi:hypothetical protein